MIKKERWIYEEGKPVGIEWKIEPASIDWLFLVVATAFFTTTIAYAIISAFERRRRP